MRIKCTTCDASAARSWIDLAAERNLAIRLTESLLGAKGGDEPLEFRVLGEEVFLDL